MNISFVYPWFLVLLLALPLLWFYPRRLGNRTHGILRTVFAGALIVALARPILLATDTEAFQVLVLDTSGSLTPRQHEEALAVARRWSAEVEDKDKSAVVRIAGEAPEQDAYADVLSAAGIQVELRDETSPSPLSTALATAARQIPDGAPGVITLVSDGLSTDRRWGPAVQALIRRGIVVHTIELARDENDVYPADIRTGEVLRAGQTVRAQVQVVGRTGGARVRLLDSQGQRLAISQPFMSEERISVPLEFEPRTPGFLTIRAEVVPEEGEPDSRTDNNVIEKTLAIQPPLRMLYLGERMQQGAERLAQLVGGGFQIEDGSGWDLAAAPDLAPYDVVMIDDRTAARVPESFQQQLIAEVRDRGLGLVMAGGKAAFGAGGYHETAIAEALPIELEQKTEKRDPSTALALIIDTSGSMGGNRMELAKQVARLAVRRLKAHDRVGIVEFYGNKHWALPLQSAANKVTIDRAIGRMQAIGGTVLYPAIEEAYYGLKNMATRYKHILIITDAGVEDSDYESLIRRIAQDNISVSTVLVGAQAHNQKLIDMASWGNGRFYSAADRFALPEVILKQPSTMKLPAYKEGRFQVIARGAQGWWGEIEHESLPSLSGYVETSVRPGAEVLIEVEGSAHPVLASRHYGLGRVTAFMTEPVGPGTSSWRDWQDYGRMLARVIQRTADESQPFRFDLDRQAGQVTLTARRYTRASHYLPQAALLDGQGQIGQMLSFRQLSPDHFVAELVVDPAEELRVNARAIDLSGQSQPRGELRLVSMPFADVSGEYQVDPRAGLDLQALAEATGGLFGEFSTDVQKGGSALKLYQLWWWLLLLALLVYLGELVWRRWPRT